MATKGKNKSSKITVADQTATNRIPTSMDEVYALFQNADRSGFQFRDREIAIAVLHITQSTSTFPDAQKHIGQVWNRLTGEYAESVELIFAGNDHPRAMEAPKDENARKKNSEAKPPLCASPNGVHPFKEYIGQQVDGEAIPPLCNGCIFQMIGDCRERLKYYGFIVNPKGKLQEFTYRPTFTSYNDIRKLNAMLQDDVARGEVWTYIMTTEFGDKWFENRLSRGTQIKDKDILQGVKDMAQNHVDRQVTSAVQVMNSLNLK